MNPFIRAASLFVLILTTTFAAEPARPPGFEGVRVKRQEMPIFPYDLIQTGVREGQACIAFSIDLAGKVDDALAVAYTHPGFARAALAMVRRWTFEPARLNGAPIATASEVVFNFEVQGTVVVSMTADEAFSAWLNGLHGLHESVYPRSLRELDRIPVPILAPTPSYPQAFVDRGRTGDVTVNFYIDDTGAVRLPAVESNNNPDLAALAITAIQKWKFEPPTVKGQKVLTKTNQVFRFRPAGAPVAGAAEKK